MVENIKTSIGKAAMGARKMTVVLWCVTAIAGIVFMHLYYAEDIGYGGLMAMMLIAALGGVDAWKQGLFEKIGNDKDKPTP